MKHRIPTAMALIGFALSACGPAQNKWTSYQGHPAEPRCRYEAAVAGQNVRGGWLYQGASEQNFFQLCMNAAMQ